MHQWHCAEKRTKLPLWCDCCRTSRITKVLTCKWQEKLQPTDARVCLFLASASIWNLRVAARHTSQHHLTDALTHNTDVCFRLTLVRNTLAVMPSTNTYFCHSFSWSLYQLKINKQSKAMDVFSFSHDPCYSRDRPLYDCWHFGNSPEIFFEQNSILYNCKIRSPEH